MYCGDMHDLAVKASFVSSIIPIWKMHVLLRICGKRGPSCFCPKAIPMAIYASSAFEYCQAQVFSPGRVGSCEMLHSLKAPCMGHPCFHLWCLVLLSAAVLSWVLGGPHAIDALVWRLEQP